MTKKLRNIDLDRNRMGKSGKKEREIEREREEGNEKRKKVKMGKQEERNNNLELVQLLASLFYGIHVKLKKLVRGDGTKMEKTGTS